MSENDDNNQKQTPHEVLRDGNLDVPLWKQEGEHGTFLKSGGVRKTYTDKDGERKNTRSLTGSENLRGGHLLIKAHERVAAFREEMRSQKNQNRDR